MKTKTKSKSSKPTEDGNKPTLVAFLLDRTGSMASCKDETIKGFNGYIKELRKSDDGKMRFTLTQFDSIGIDILHDAEPLKSVLELNAETYEPRAGTPLYDAIGKTVRKTQEQAGGKYKVLFVTLTDGQENSSSEWTEQGIKDLIKEMESKEHWTFAYIGVGLNGFRATQQMAHGTVGASNVLRSSHKNTEKAYRQFSRGTVAYAMCASNVGVSASNFWGDKDASTEDAE